MDELSINQLVAFAPAVFLHFVRAASFVSVCPLFGLQGDSRFLRLMLAVSLGTMFWWVGNKFVAVPDTAVELIVIVIREVALGTLGAFVASLMLAIPQIGGEILATEMGFAINRIVNPATGSSATPVAQFFGAFATLLIFSSDLHHEIIRVLGASYRAIPVGHTFDYNLLFERLMPEIYRTITFGLMFAMPLLGVMMLLTTILVLLSRAVQNINLMEFSFAIRILLALTGSTLVLLHGTPFLISAFSRLIETAQVFFEGA